MSKSIYRKEEIIRPDASVGFVILSYTLEDVYYKMKESLSKNFSDVLFESIPLAAWIPSTAETGFNPPGNKSRILSFKRRINREELPEIKEKCILLANSFLKLDNSVKIIPGYQTLYNTVLGSTTDDFHKIYLFHGVFAEVVYKYETRQLQSTDTAPLFFANTDVIYYFTNLREYFNQSKQIK